MNLREAAEAALDVLENYAPQHGEPEDICEAINALRESLAEAEAPDVALTATEQEIMHRALRRSSTKIEAEKAEPVAWTVDYEINGLQEGLEEHLIGRSMQLEPYFPPHQVKYLYTHPPAALPESAAWTPVTTRHPPWDERKVVCYTEGYDYGGAQFITMPASDFHCYDEDDPDEPGSRESKTVSHWIYEDDLIAAARGEP